MNFKSVTTHRGNTLQVVEIKERAQISSIRLKAFDCNPVKVSSADYCLDLFSREASEVGWLEREALHFNVAKPSKHP